MLLIRRIITGLIGLIGLIYAIYFSVRNMEALPLNMPLLGDFVVPGFVGYLGAFILGAVIVAVFSGFEHVRKSMQLRKLRKELNGSRRQPHKRVRRFLKEDEPVTQPEPSIQSLDSKEF
ncbi:MAG: LapA family protein [Proteobacteria bacterium]|nr:MAG: LapA family protein [Pseudomonadota bacterium]